MNLPRTCWVKFDEWEQCILHFWSTDYEEYKAGPGQFPVGVVQRRRGPLKSVDVKDIHLTMPPEWRQQESNNTCPVCKEETHNQYMLRNECWNECWKEAGINFYDNVHLECLQKLLGRPLVNDDFTADPINDGVKLPINDGVKP